jgi:hypothetical protein
VEGSLVKYFLVHPEIGMKDGKSFWGHLLSGDQGTVNSYTFLALMMSAPVMVLCFAVVINEVWFLGKGLTSQVEMLLNVMMGAATGGVLGHGISSFSQSSSYSQFSSIGGMMGGEQPYVPPGPPPHKANPAP